MEREVNSRSAQIFDEIGAALKGQNLKSIEEAQTFLDDLTAKRNAESIPEFLGLSSNQMNRLLYRPFAETSDIVVLKRNLSKEDLLGIPLVKEAIYFMKRLSELQPLRATTKGNLPQAFSREMHDKFPEHPHFHFSIRSEEEDSKLSALRHILDMAGWIKKRDQRFSLTQKGQDVVDKGFGIDDFYHLFETYVRRFNWASRDLYPSLDIIQQGFLFSCYLLHQKAKTSITVKELSNCFIQAFPAVLRQEERHPSTELEELVHHAFSVRFIERFCEYFGLVTIQRRKGQSNLEYFLKITPLFEKIFHWKLGAAQGT
jgi:hypothetical protein